MSRPAPTSAVLAVLALAAWAPGAAAQVPVPGLPIDPVAAEIPQSSAISEQYRAVEEVVAEALPAAPEAALAPPAEPDPAPKPAPAAPAAEQYHSETPPNVSVTQQQPSNVNVSIRINSPGDDGPVVQINNAGGIAVVEQVVEAVRMPAAPAPDAPPAALPETWEWVWTSACFGGGARAAAAAPGWSWRWSCDDGRAQDVPGGPAAPDAWPLAGVPGFAEALAVAAPSLPFVGAPDRGRAERAPPARRRDGAVAVGGAGGPAAGPPPIALARSLAAATTTAVAEPVRDVVRTVARARPGRAGASSLLFPPGEGPAAGASHAPGAAASLLLGIWIAVLIAAIVLVLPRIRRRRWSGPAWRQSRGPSARLERPG